MSHCPPPCPFSLLTLGADTLTPAIIEHVWGQDDVVQFKCRLISLACVANNSFHLWLTTPFDSKTFITVEALQHVPPGVCNILLLIKENTSAIYAHEPLPSGKDCIQILQHNL